MRIKTVLAAAAIALLPAAPAHVLAATDPVAAGGDVFDVECSDCHSLKAGKNKKGPSLSGVVGRKAGTAPGFEYSPAMLASGITWTPDRIDAYLAAPKKVVPNGKMKYDGLAGAQDRANLIRFLGEQK